MKTFVMKIKDKFIESILLGQKKHEYRLNDDERQQIKCNDRIVLISSSNRSKYICTKVSKVEVFSSWSAALKEYWTEDFKNIYSDFNEAIKECRTFYDNNLVNKYGIVVFTISPIKLEINYSRILLDTNVIIERESIVNPLDSEFANKVMISLKHLQDINCHFFVSSSTCREISKYRNNSIKEAVLNKINNSYEMLSENNTKPDEFFIEALKDFKKDENGNVDNNLLLQLYNEKCDYLYTNDYGILKKAEKLYLSEKILDTGKILSNLIPNDDFYKEYNSSFIRLLKFKEINLNDTFFDSLKEDYPKFAEWFIKKSNEKCYVYEKDNNIKGFLYVKIENEDENYNDFVVPFTEKKKRLKVGTFKILSTGMRLGERFIQIIVDICLKNHINEIYVTLFENKRDEVLALKKLLEKWGFCEYTHKKSNHELVLVKKIISYDTKKTVNQNYPLSRPNHNYYFLPISSEYHYKLFPDLRLKFENGKSEEMACNNALEKIYITKFSKTNVSTYKEGDVLIIYRMGEDGTYKRFSSFITGTALFKSIKCFNSSYEMEKAVKNKSVFIKEEIKSLYEQGYKTIISLIYTTSFKKKIVLDWLQSKGIIEAGSGARIMQQINDADYRLIKKEGKYDY